MNSGTIKIIDFQPELAEHFGKINLLWIEKFFEPEPEDLKVLFDPQKYLIDQGGAVLYAEYQGNIVGTCGLKRWSDTEYELVKMGVLEGYQGLSLGEMLGKAIINLAKSKGCKRLYLETNSQLTPAIQLYKKLGFVEYQQDSSRCDYQRCDLYMEQFFS